MEQFHQGNVPVRHLLNEETLFTSWWRFSIKEVNDWALLAFSFHNYVNNGKWIGNQSCSDDPIELFESIVFKLEDFVESIIYKYFDDTVEEYSESKPKLPNKLWSATDNRNHGRCFTTIPTPDHIQYGIKSIILYLKAEKKPKLPVSA